MQKGSGLSEASPCLMQAWGAHQAELRGWLHQRLPDTATAQDLLQDVFLIALRQGQAFCGVANARAWLFEVTRNTLTDHLRLHPIEDARTLARLGLIMRREAPRSALAEACFALYQKSPDPS